VGAGRRPHDRGANPDRAAYGGRPGNHGPGRERVREARLAAEGPGRSPRRSSRRSWSPSSTTRWPTSPGSFLSATTYQYLAQANWYGRTGTAQPGPRLRPGQTPLNPLELGAADGHVHAGRVVHQRLAFRRGQAGRDEQAVFHHAGLSAVQGPRLVGGAGGGGAAPGDAEQPPAGGQEVLERGDVGGGDWRPDADAQTASGGTRARPATVTTAPRRAASREKNQMPECPA
jgi:hypothetical protein